MKLAEKLAKLLKPPAGAPSREDVTKLDSTATPPVNLEEDLITRLMLAQTPTIAYSGASYIYREQ